MKLAGIIYGHLCLLLGAATMYLLTYEGSTPHIEYGSAVLSNQIVGVPQGEPIDCQFDEPVSIVISVLHYYDNYEELNLDWQTYEVAEEDDEVWGFSDCEWQQEHNFAACDVYTVHPKYVDDTEESPVFETIGHEVYHGACGDFHD